MGPFEIVERQNMVGNKPKQLKKLLNPELKIQFERSIDGFKVRS